jgi:putative transposase
MSSKSVSSSLVSLAGSDDPLGLSDLAESFVEQARTSNLALTGEGGLLTSFVRHVLQTSLNIELEDHLGYQRHAVTGYGSGNSRNGSYPKTVTTEIGEITIDVPRDRNGTFEPVTVPKGVRRNDGLTAMIISLYAKGMTTGDIQTHLSEMYGTELSRDTISKITDTIIEDMHLWQNRALDPLYPVLLIDAIYLKIRDGQVANRPIYVVLGINMLGEREVLGMWVGPTGGEGAKYWAGILTELKNRGLHDTFIVCCDGLKGLPESIRSTWPQADVQLCVVHLVRSSLRFTSKKDWGHVCRDLKHMYTAPTLQAAEILFQQFKHDWEQKYPAMIRTWETSWNQFVPFLDFPIELRKLVYTTNSIESINARLRKAVGRRGHFPTEQSALKVLYLTVTEKRKNRANPTGKISGWKTILNTLTIHYTDRIPAGI